MRPIQGITFTFIDVIFCLVPIFSYLFKNVNSYYRIVIEPKYFDMI